MGLPVLEHRPDAMISRGTHWGVEWVVMHNGMRFYCGYVKVWPDHPWYGVLDGHLEGIDVHGGLTYSGRDSKGNAYWVGFDMAHAGDRPDLSLPASEETLRFEEMIGRAFMDNPWDDWPKVRTRQDAEFECKCLCEQAVQAWMNLYTHTK